MAASYETWVKAALAAAQRNPTAFSTRITPQDVVTGILGVAAALVDQGLLNAPLPATDPAGLYRAPEFASALRTGTLNNYPLGMDFLHTALSTIATPSRYLDRVVKRWNAVVDAMWDAGLAGPDLLAAVGVVTPTILAGQGTLAAGNWTANVYAKDARGELGPTAATYTANGVLLNGAVRWDWAAVPYAASYLLVLSLSGSGTYQNVVVPGPTYLQSAFTVTPGAGAVPPNPGLGRQW